MPYTVASPSPVPFPISLVVKNGSKMWIKHFLVHAAAIVAYREHHIFTADKTQVNSAICLIEVDVFRLDGDLTHPGDGVPGVDAKIGQNLVDLGGVNLDLPQARSRHPDEINILADQPQQHLEHARHGVV